MKEDDDDDDDDDESAGGKRTSHSRRMQASYSIKFVQRLLCYGTQ